MKKVWLAVGLSSALAAACGDDGDGDVAASKKVGELSTSEEKSFCGEVEQTLTRLQKIVTTVMCTERARDDQATCSNVRRTCIDDPSFEVDIHDKIDFECADSDVGITQVCPNVTVGELRTCVDGIVDALEAMADQFTCTADPSTLKAPALPRACDDLGERCATLSGFSLD